MTNPDLEKQPKDEGESNELHPLERKYGIEPKVDESYFLNWH